MVSPEVCTLETRRKTESKNTNAQWLVQSGIDNERPWFDAGLYGNGQVVAVSDTGLDINNCYFQDTNAGDAPYEYPTNIHRKIVQYITFGDRTDEQYGHGTHVVGTICGSRGDPNNPNSGMVPGVAPEAKVSFFDMAGADGISMTPSNIKYLCKTGRNHDPPAKIHSASWGTIGDPTHTVNAAQIDNYMYQNDDFLMIIAAGNQGRGNKAKSIETPATAQNILAVGASHSCCGQLGRNQLGPDHVADFSSRGPTDDGRTKPDLVAPGKWILSAGSRPDAPGSCDSDKAPGIGVKAAGVMSLSGTSMATPIVAGSAALIRQYFEEGFYPTGERVAANAMDPSGVMVKAVLINGAQYLDAVDSIVGTTPLKPYDNAQNFGRISFIDSLYMKGKTSIQAKVWDRTVIRDGKEQIFKVTIDKSNGCNANLLSATLTWVEGGSMPGCKSCLLNDLDLTITREGGDDNRIYYPNGLNGPDQINNAERVQLTDGDVQDGDTLSIHVKATNLAASSQTYALVATACMGGVASTLDTMRGNFFTNDHSESTRRNKFILIICGIVGGLVLVVCGVFYFSKRRSRKEAKAEGEREAAAAAAAAATTKAKPSPKKRRQKREEASTAKGETTAALDHAEMTKGE